MSNSPSWTISDLRQYLFRCAYPDLFTRSVMWIMSWFMGREFREMMRGFPESQRSFVRQIGIIDSMTSGERVTPELIGQARENRIAQGSGTRPSEVRQLLQMHRTLRERHVDRGNKRRKS